MSPKINMQHGETRYSFLAGIDAHDGVGVLSSGSQRQLRVVPPVLKGEKEDPFNDWGEGGDLTNLSPFWSGRH